MAKKDISKSVRSKAGWTIGSKRFAKISSVEGVVLTPAMRDRFEKFDREGVSAHERRQTIIRSHKKG